MIILTVLDEDVVLVTISKRVRSELIVAVLMVLGDTDAVTGEGRVDVSRYTIDTIDLARCRV